MKRSGLMATVLVCAGVIAASALAATRAYFVEPRELHEGWSPQGQNAFVGQSFVANIDSIYYLEWFVGEPSAEGQYEFEIMEGDLPVCAGYESVPARGWQWVRCSTFTGSLQLTKGKEYLLKVSHSAGDSVNYVVRTDNPYQYGAISVGGGEGQPPPQTTDDLVGRVVGRMDVMDSTTDWGVTA